MTVKSDDVIGRVKVYEALVKGQKVDQAGVPESFRVLIKEFQALGLNIQIIDDKGQVLDLKQIEKDEVQESMKMTIDEVEINKIVDKDETLSEEDFDDDLNDDDEIDLDQDIMEEFEDDQNFETEFDESEVDF